MLVRWMIEDAEEQRKGDGIKSDMMSKAEAAMSGKNEGSVIEQAIAYKKLMPIEKYRIGIKTLNAQ